MEHRNGSSAKLGELHNNASRAQKLVDLDETRRQLHLAQKQAADEKNAKEELREALVKINRMVGGQGWTSYGEVIASVQRKLSEHSGDRVNELVQQINQADATEKQLRELLAHEKQRADGAAKSAEEARIKFHNLTIDHEKAQAKLKTQELEIERQGRIKLALKAVPDPAPVPVELQERIDTLTEERDAILGLFDMHKRDQADLMANILRAADEAEKAVFAGMQSEKNSSRGLKAMNYGLRLGSSAIVAAIARVIHNVYPAEESA
jgi:hypothetical protein